ncbi:RNA-dependent RNA polymerase [Hardenbergia virus A]|uniref:RNA-dependent RNA polymerase n=2 Tax=Hardenbergia virus A TaxID=1003891 RepID=F4ZNG9_9VIRU|nr:RNA-dependent RNA polymerase [Hardenbergia virus A]AEB00587.1 RNA-dependent RNA polymerase [Hardenbergia virus A]
MSLVYRTPIESLINQLPSRLTENLAVNQVDILQHEEETYGRFLNFSLNKEQKKFLADKGVYLSPYSWRHHSHPACKTIENWLLYYEVGHYIRNLKKEESVNFLSLRGGKLNAIKKIHSIEGKDNNFYEKIMSFNRMCCAKDKLRYQNSSEKELLYSTFGEISEKVGKNGFFFVHDECHYWDPAMLENFISRVEPDSMVATVIHPMEVEKGKESSHLPFLYDFEINGDKIFFFPDGNKSEGYEQPKSAGWWLRMSKFTSSKGVYSLTLLRSIGPFHLILLTKQDRVVESKRFFDDFSIIDLPHSFEERHLIKRLNLVLRSGFLRKIVSYIKSLKKPDRESAIAKLRMMSEDDFSIEEMLFVEGMVDSMLKDGCKSIWEKGWADALVNYIVDLLPKAVQSYFFRKDYKAKENLDLLLNLNSLSIKLDTVPYDFSSFVPKENVSLRKELDALLDNNNGVQKGLLNNKSRSEFLFQRGSSEYSGRRGLNDILVFDGPTINNSIQSSIFESNLGNFLNGLSPENHKAHMNSMKVILSRDPRYKIDSMKRSMRNSSLLRNNYGFIITKSLKTQSIFGQYGVEIVFVDKSKRNQIDIVIYIITACYVMHSQIDNSISENLDSELTYTEQHKLKDLALSLFECKSFSDEIKDENHSCNASSSSHVENRKCDSDVIDERIFCNLSNKCCFESIMNAMSWDFMVLLDKLKGSKFLKLLIDDNGLLEEELVEMVDYLGLSFNLINQSGSTVIYSESNSHTLVLSSNHCMAAESKSVMNWTLNEKANFLNLPGVSYIRKNLYQKERATKLYRSLCKGSTGVLFNVLNKKTKETDSTKYKNRILEFMSFFFNDDFKFENQIESLHEPVYGFFGFAGSGKSRNIQNYINDNFKNGGRATIISPRNELLKDWSSKIKCNNKHIRMMTYEKALTVSYSNDELVVIDEIGLLPPGYISLLSLIVRIKTEEISQNVRLSKRNFLKFLNRTESRLVLIGDHLQCRYFNDSDTRLLEHSDEIDFVMEQEEIIYLNYSLRMAKNHHYKPGVKFFGETESKTTRRFLNVFVAKKAIPDAQVLVASHDEQVRFRELGAKTYGESQGLTMEQVIIVLSPPSINCSVYMWNVAMSRSTCAVHFALNGFDSIDDFLNRVKGTPVASMILGMEFDIHAQKFKTDKDPKLIKVERLCLSQSDVENKLEGDPFLKSIIPSLDEGFPIDVEYKEANIELPTPKIHLPIESIENHICYVSSMIRNREYREFIGDGSMSEQFPDFWKKGEPGYLLSQPERFQAIFPKHSNQDSLTFFAAVKKRLKFSSPHVEREKFEKVRHLGSEMFDVFLSKINLDNSYNHELMQMSVNEYIEKKVSKTSNTIKSHSSRSEPDWKLNDVFLFMKTQLCTKYEKRFCDAKAGQTLACFSHIVLNRFAAPTRYIEKKISQCLPSNYYIHQKKNFDCLNEWVIRNDFSESCLESDYEAFDSSQDCLILAFEYELLKYMGWKQDLLDDYLDLKFNLGCRLGNLAVMRFTGEFGTFLFNTLANMVFTFMSYELNGKESICFAGDDMCCNKGIKKRIDGKFDHILKRLSLKAKAMITNEPTFCGWRLTPFGIYKKPELILERFLIAIEKGRLVDVIDSYYLECSYAYSLGERLSKCFSEKDFVAHYCCVRLVHKHKSLLKGLSLIKFKENKRFCFSCKLSTQNRSLTSSMEDKRMLNALEYQTSTQMEAIQRMIRSTVHRPLKAPYQSGSKENLQESFKVFQYLSQMCLLRKEARKSTQRLTLEQLSLAYTSLGTIQKKHARESVCLLMEEGSGRMELFIPLDLIYQMGPLISSLHLMLYLISMMRCWIEPVKFSSLLKTCSIYMDLVLFPLKSDQFTGCLMSSIVTIDLESQGEKEPLETLSRRCMELVFCLKMKKIEPSPKWRRPEFQVSYQMLELNQTESCMREGGALCAHGRNVDPVFIGIIVYHLSLDPAQKMYANLGQALVTLMNEEFLRTFWIVRLSLPLNHQTHRVTSGRMATAEAAANQALQDWINNQEGFQGEAYGVRMRKMRRRTLLRNYWVSTMKGSFQNLGNANTPQNFTDAESVTYGRIMSDFAAHAFGILAEEGFSPATSYSSVGTNYTIDYGAPVGSTTIRFNPAEVARTFKYLYQSSPNNLFENMTWRQCGEAFATDIVRYFKELQPDAQSWLVKSNPVLAGNAPWVALDVTDGLDIRHLNPEEKKVIARAKNHLLRSMQLKGKESLSAEALLES